MLFYTISITCETVYLHRHKRNNNDQATFEKNAEKAFKTSLSHRDLNEVKEKISVKGKEKGPTTDAVLTNVELEHIENEQAMAASSLFQLNSSDNMALTDTPLGVGRGYSFNRKSTRYY